MTKILVIWDLGVSEIITLTNPAPYTLQLTHKLTQQVGEFAVEKIAVVNKTKSISEEFNVVVETSLTKVNNLQVVNEIVKSGISSI
ncbi:hypothetical protein [Enterobacter kobei]|uniref:hypothetical protein n=1 Tax=Enterobacter kobei TaxID=208224 RepID=UPI002A82E656|nr:hypothetical protein [Enterobacter kobei]